MELLYKKYKRRKVGLCNLCRQQKRLSWDHVPPKGGIELQPVEIDRIASAFVSSFAIEKPEISHDGLRFRTLCGDCNSLLGTKYDTALNDFALSVGRFLKSELQFPSVVHIDARPTAIIRSVLGHLLAARLSPEDSFYDPIIRTLVLEPEAKIPKELNVFYWLHPYAQQIIVRDCLMPARRGKYSEFQRFGLLKYFPIGYLVTNIANYEGLSTMTEWRTEPSTHSVQVPVRLQEIRNPFWPEAPAPGNFLLFGQEGIESLRAHPKRAWWKTGGLSV